MKYRMASYELCALAVIAFLVDHTGETFFREDQWFRVFRLFAFVWFFPAGYNSGWRSGVRVWVGLAVLSVFDAILYRALFPLCALGTLLVIRPLIDPLMSAALKSARRFWAIQFALVLLILPTNAVLEYGSMAMMIAMAGWLVRHKGRIPGGIVSLPHYFVFVTAIYLALSQAVFHFNWPQLAFVVVTTSLTAALMYNFKDLLLEDLARKKQKEDIVRKICRFISRNTLEIYVLQFLLLKAMLACAVYL